ncbi:lipoprotein-anchoring transpeptidase ErfK/SrfK [Evansella vedderi]|uniref:Lipoprotein-anchoring transpeptidase ErfK/SrfK n=1 Tax=Evansella vedderi TaxID=38282 RepID=A0ABT9ZZ25_9BACI|nr:L,D-transpeptidase [Evansella vedderi]MDQ0256220.1 lipoprotein-anchoring transpeptidase ErfK/SrfK [Evansella vedderi]
MRFIFLSLLLVISPIWPIGENPLVGDPYIIVNKKTNELAYILDGEVKQVYEVATGKSDSVTPEGEHTVTVKAVDPYYRKENIEGGNKKNPLGSRWIGFDAEETDGRIYGIHGTNNPASIGHYVTNGCVRMKNEDVEILFEEVLIGMKVLVISSDEGFEEIGKKHGAIADN